MIVLKSHTDHTTSHSPAGVAYVPSTEVPAQVVVRSDWNTWRAATVPVSALEDVHWRRPAGAPRRLLHGYVWCNSVLASHLPHQCSAAVPHRVLVCVLERDTVATLFGHLSMRADGHTSGEVS